MGGPCGGTITRTYRATDACGNFAECTQTITIDDNTNPTIACPSDITVECVADVPAADINSVTAADNCGSVTVTWEGDGSLVGGACGGTITRTYRATDACGNFAECTQTITIDDTTDPTIACPADIMVQCMGDVPAPDINSVTASDNCGSVTVTHVGDSPLVGGVLTRTYRATDDCGNFVECTQTITVDDTTPPTIGCPADMDVECIGEIPSPDINTVTANDNCGAVTVTHVGDGAFIGGPCGGTITRTYRATDAAGNTTDCDQVFTIHDITAPTIACPAAITVACEADVPAADINSVTVSDNCGSAQVTWEGDTQLSGGSCGGTITRTYRATDVCGNTAECTQIITVNDDVDPTIACPAGITVDCEADVPEADINSVTADDNCGSVTVTWEGDTQLSGGICGGTITRTYRATDVCGNFAECTQTITVHDQIDPIIDCPAGITVECEADVPAPDVNSVTSEDNCSAMTVTWEGDTQLSGGPCGGTIARTYRVTDECGNFAECIQTITVQDQTDPTIACPAGITVECVEDVPAADINLVTADDNCGSVTVTWEGDSPLSGGPCGGTITRTYRATDLCGNIAECTQTITVDDNTPPVVMVVPDTTIFLCDPTEICIPFTATDNCSGDLGYYLGPGPSGATISPGMWCFTPTENVDQDVYLLVQDQCGNQHNEIFHLKVTLNEPPVCDFQAPTPGACAPSNLVVPITSTDPEGGPTDCQLISGPGTLNGGVWSYSPAPGEAFTVVIRCYDDCGAYCEISFDYTAPNPDPPVCVLPTSDQNFDLCQPGQISVPVSATGGAGAVNCQVISGPGSISGGQWSYNATVDESFTVTVECTDACGVSCQGSFDVDINVNEAPVCNGPGDMTIEKCDLTEIVLPMTASDPDGNLAGCQVISGPGSIVGGTWHFTPPAFAQYCVTVQCSDDCGATCETSFCVDVVQRVDCQCLIDVSINGGMNIDALNDQTVTVPITIDDMNSGIEVGGFDLLICYDRTAIGAIQVNQGAAVADWEYFTYRNGINSNCGSPGCPSGIIRVVGIADLDNGPTMHPPTSAYRPIGSVAEISFRVTSDRNFIGQCIPIRFCWYDCGDNTISSRTGDTLFVQLNGWDPSCLSNPKVEPLPGICFDSAAICIQEPPDDRGDLNLNFIANEVGDAVLYSQYFIFGESVFDPVWKNSQILASDVNDDGIVLTVADLIYLIRIITGDAQAFPADPGSPKMSPYLSEAEATFSIHDGRALVSTNSTSELGGAVLVFRYSDMQISEPTLLTNGSGLKLTSSAKRGELRVLITPDMAAHNVAIPAGQNDLIAIPFEGNGTLELVEAQFSDASGALLASKLTKDAAAVPGSYALYQNFPNPFNAGTVIRFDLKDASDWTLNVYNVAGQVVRTFNGRNEASQVDIQWDGRDNRGHDLASGVYFYRVTAADFTATKKMTLLK